MKISDTIYRHFMSELSVITHCQIAKIYNEGLVLAFLLGNKSVGLCVLESDSLRE